MNKSVIVSIKREDGCVRVSNDLGQEWVIPCSDSSDVDTSTSAAVAVVANAMLTGTITSQLYHSDAKVLTYKLTLITT